MVRRSPLTPAASSFFLHFLLFCLRLTFPAYGHGIYFAVDGTVSMGHYAQATGAQRANSDFLISSVFASLLPLFRPKV